MPRPDHDLELILARWTLGVLDPEEVPALATEALVRGCEARSVAILAGLQKPLRYADIQDEVPGFVRELGVSLPSERDALKTHVDSSAAEIVNGTVTPLDGAQWMITPYYWASAELRDQIWTIYSLVFEYHEENRPAAVLDGEIVSAAKAFLASGGLRIPDG